MDVYRALHPILVYGRIFGIHPNSDNARHKPLLYLYTCLYSALIIVSSLVSLLPLLKSKENMKPIIYLVIDKSQTVIALTNFAVAFSSSFFKSNNLKRILSDLHEAEKELSSIGVKVQYKTINLKVSLSIFLFSHCVLICLYLYLESDSVLYHLLFKTVCTHFPLISVNAKQLQAHALLNFIVCHISAIVTVMEGNNLAPNSKKWVCLLRFHEVLKQNALRLSSCFSFNTILSLISILFYAIVNLYMVARSGIKPFSELSVFDYLYCIGFVALKIFELWNIIEPFVLLRNKNEKFNAILFKLMINHGDLPGNEKLQLHIAMKQDIQFSASGFFNLDYSLIQSMIGVVATFLVILIQFDINAYK